MKRSSSNLHDRRRQGWKEPFPRDRATIFLAEEIVALVDPMTGGTGRNRQRVWDREISTIPLRWRLKKRTSTPW